MFPQVLLDRMRTLVSGAWFLRVRSGVQIKLPAQKIVHKLKLSKILIN